VAMKSSPLAKKDDEAARLIPPNLDAVRATLAGEPMLSPARRVTTSARRAVDGEALLPGRRFVRRGVGRILTVAGQPIGRQ
jgi:hypothetical protein